MLFVLCQIGVNRYALPASQVVEVLPLVRLMPLPQLAQGVAGVFNYRGQPVPVFDLSQFILGQPDSNSQAQTEAFDETLSMSQVLEIVTPFIAGGK